MLRPQAITVEFENEREARELVWWLWDEGFHGNITEDRINIWIDYPSQAYKAMEVISKVNKGEDPCI